MERAHASEFTHTSATTCPQDVSGYAFGLEADGSTGVYLESPSGALWPARTVSRDDMARHDDIIAAWSGKGKPARWIT